MDRHDRPLPILTSVVAATALLLSPVTAHAQEPASGSPGPEHEELMSLVGSWEVSSAGERSGSAHATSRLDGRFLQIEIEADTGPIAHAFYTFGFDRRHGRYIVSAMDNSGTYWVTAHGNRDGDRIPMYGKDDDPVMASMGFEKEFVIVLHLRGPDHVEIQTLFVDTRTPERKEIPFMSFDLRRSETDVSDAVRRTELAFAATMADRDLAEFVQFIADDAVFIGGSGALRGVEAIRDGWSPFFDGADAPFSWEPAEVEVLDSGTLALSSGPVRDPSGKLIGTFNSVWRKEAGGGWKVVFDKGCPVCRESE